MNEDIQQIVQIITNSLSEDEHLRSESLEFIDKMIETPDTINLFFQILSIDDTDNNIIVCVCRLIKKWWQRQKNEIDSATKSMIFGFFHEIFQSSHFTVFTADLFIYLSSSIDEDDSELIDETNGFISLVLASLNIEMSIDILFPCLQVLHYGFKNRGMCSNSELVNSFCETSSAIVNLFIERGTFSQNECSVVLKIFNCLKYCAEIDLPHVAQFKEYSEYFIELFLTNNDLFTNNWKLFAASLWFLSIKLMPEQSQELVAKMLSMLQFIHSLGITHLTSVLVDCLVMKVKYLQPDEETFALLVSAAEMNDEIKQTFDENPEEYYSAVYQANGYIYNCNRLLWILSSSNNELLDILLSLEPNETIMRCVGYLSQQYQNCGKSEELKEWIQQIIDCVEEPIDVSALCYLIKQSLGLYSKEEIQEIASTLLPQFFDVESEVILKQACKLAKNMSRISGIIIPDELVEIIIQLMQSPVSRFAISAFLQIVQSNASNDELLKQHAADIYDLELTEGVEEVKKCVEEEEDVLEFSDRMDLIAQFVPAIEDPSDERIIFIIQTVFESDIYDLIKAIPNLCLAIISANNDISFHVSRLVSQALLSGQPSISKKYYKFLYPLMKLMMINHEAFAETVDYNSLIHLLFDLYDVHHNEENVDFIAWIIQLQFEVDVPFIISKATELISSVNSEQIYFLKVLQGLELIASLSLAGVDCLSEEIVTIMSQFAAEGIMNRRYNICLFIALFSKLENEEVVGILKTILNNKNTMNEDDFYDYLDTLSTPAACRAIHDYTEAPLGINVN